ncbi:MAG: ribonuclease Y [Verrucomicrobiota bacterium]
MLSNPLILCISALTAAAGFGVAVVRARKREQATAAARLAEQQSWQDRLRRETEAAQLAAKLAAQEQRVRDRVELEKALSSRQETIAAEERRLVERESTVDRQLDRIARLESEIDTRSRTLESDRTALEHERQQLRQHRVEARARLESIAGLDAEGARTMLLQEVEREARKDAADLSRHLLENARRNAETEARRIVGITLQRCAATQTFESTTATVAVSGSEMKGRIIGREGRNIRAFESITGVTVLVDDTPNAVVLSAFDPVRREVARLAMERLVLDGRIHPARIEEVVAAVNTEMEGFILQTGEAAVARTGLPPLCPEIARLLGKLHFRYSYSQNVLHHSVEVAHLTGLMAAEMGQDIQAAKLSGLLHDIGKALSQEVEGPHAIVGGNFLRQQGQPPHIVNAVASHHDEVPHENLLGILVSAADAISASRPGSRSESMTTYLQRLENLERIATGFPGVEKAYAVQAGRELRVMVKPEELDDAASYQLARQIAHRIEEDLLYPGQIRITVVRETRCVEFAK